MSYTDQPSYDDIPESIPKLCLPGFTYTKNFTVEDRERPIVELYASRTNEIVADRRFVNLTVLENVTILDGATGQRIFSKSRGIYNHEQEFRIITSISSIPEHMGYARPGIPGRDQMRPTREYVISEEALRQGPVYIPPLNITVVAGDYVNSTAIPDVERDMCAYKTYMETQAQKAYQRGAYTPYMILPMSYKGSREFYLGINDTICLLPILLNDDTIQDKPKFILKWRDGIDRVVKDVEIVIDPIAQLKQPEIVVGDQTLLLSTNRELIRTILDDKLAASLHQTKVEQHLKNQITTLTQDKKFLEEEILHLKANVELGKYYSDLEHKERMQHSKERVEDKKNWMETVKSIGIAITAVGVIAKVLMEIYKAGKSK